MLRNLRVRALEESPGAFLGNLRKESGQTDVYWQSKCTDEYWFMADVGDVAAGLANLARAMDESEPMHIESMWVVPRYRRTGIGRVIVQSLESAASKLGESEIRLWVFRENTAGRIFFERLGYAGPIKVQPLDIGTSIAIEQEFWKKLG